MLGTQVLRQLYLVAQNKTLVAKGKEQSSFLKSQSLIIGSRPYLGIQ